MTDGLKHWQDGYNNALESKAGSEGEAFRAEKHNFPKLWITAGTDQKEVMFFSPIAGKVYTNTKEGSIVHQRHTSVAVPMGPNGEKLNCQTLIKPNIPSLQRATVKSHQRPLLVYWKETEPEERRQSCLVYLNLSGITYKFWDFEAMEKTKTSETELFSFGSPLKEAKL
eukprot:CAMPEP_0204617390 /NCGR_PEP_ID=MMETSP0717-20131115/4385_1 /ASSEMBLY_ACC=CAM_ASM_000666 /TAXON_ID=230516 /ORGANISM="Chaetoceros curvisetus" /LENGTH=168 /DNA_ID=CAMNT_0051630911 /DNA_START=50 /DNA_END=553 /DNA_ORIENTATION=+